MQLAAEDGRFLGGGIGLIIASEKKRRLREGDPH